MFSKKTTVDKNAPEGFSMNNWKKGDSEVMLEFQSFKVEIRDDSDELYFLKLFVDEEIIASLTLQTNKYAADFIQTNAQKLGEHSRFSKWPEDVIKTNKILTFIALYILLCETSYECALCQVSLWVVPCFSMYHTQQHYENGYKA